MIVIHRELRKRFQFNYINQTNKPKSNSPPVHQNVLVTLISRPTSQVNEKTGSDNSKE